MKRLKTLIFLASSLVNFLKHIFSLILQTLCRISFPLRLILGVKSSFNVAAMTDKGARRKNQDRIYWSILPNMLLALVADGLGGEVAGDVAANICVHVFKNWKRYFKNLNPLTLLRKLMEDANQQIYEQTPHSAIMGTTCSALLVQKQGNSYVLNFAHVGDCRLYVIHDGVITQTTKEHIKIHEGKRYVANFLGMGNSLSIDTGEQPLLPGDILILCTDGISNEISSEQLCSVALCESPKSACRKLIQMAKRQGGSRSDNMSIIVAKLRNQ